MFDHLFLEVFQDTGLINIKVLKLFQATFIVEIDETLLPDQILSA